MILKNRKNISIPREMTVKQENFAKLPQLSWCSKVKWPLLGYREDIYEDVYKN